MMCILLPPLVTEEVLFVTTRRMGKENIASGPDGVPARVLKVASNILSGTIIDIFNVCLVEGKFPTEWRRADLILLPKSGKRDWQVSSSYQPICLINEAAKMLEKVIADRVCMSWACLNKVGPNLSDVQFGRRADRSKMAIDRMVTLVRSAVSPERGGRVVLVVSLDIVNVFNSLPWTKILQALFRYNVYLRRVIGDYLLERSVIYCMEKDQDLS